MIVIREPGSIYQTRGQIENGTFSGRWHFSFGGYHDADYTHFGTLRVFNDDTMSPGSTWPLHPHRDNEVVTYCADGEFRHEDENGKGGILKKGWVQHTTIGRGMWHSEINNRKDIPMRFIQMWFLPSEHDRPPSVEQKKVNKADRTDRFLPLVSNDHEDALSIISDAAVYSCFLRGGNEVVHALRTGVGAYLYVLEGGPVLVNDHKMIELAASKITGEKDIHITAIHDTELLLVEVLLD